MIQSETERERVLLVGVSEQDEEETKRCLEELCELAKTAGAEVAGGLM